MIATKRPDQRFVALKALRAERTPAAVRDRCGKPAAVMGIFEQVYLSTWLDENFDLEQNRNVQ